VAEFCTKPEVGVGQSNRVIQNFARPTLVAIVTKIWCKFPHKNHNNSTRI